MLAARLHGVLLRLGSGLAVANWLAAVAPTGFQVSRLVRPLQQGGVGKEPPVKISEPAG